jgi:hypothetical protein
MRRFAAYPDLFTAGFQMMSGFGVHRALTGEFAIGFLCLETVVAMVLQNGT